MPILDRYIARLYLTNVVALFVILFCFVVTIDVSLNVSRFAKAAEQAASLAAGQEITLTGLDQARGTAAAVIDLWWPRLLQLYNFLLGTVLVVSAGFTCTQLVRNREVVAMLAAGQSVWRVARPVLGVAVFMTALAAANQELVIPRLAPLLLRDHREAALPAAAAATVPLTSDAQGRLLRAASFDPGANTLTGLRVWERGENAIAERIIAADRATWNGEAWILENGVASTRVPEELGTQRPPLEPVARLESTLDPDELRLRLFKRYQQFLSIGQTREMLSRPELLGPEGVARLERIQYGRISVMLSSLLTLTIALPFFLPRQPKPPVLQALKCAPISIAALVGGVIGSSAAVPGLPPEISAFLPVIVLLPIAAAAATFVRS